MPVTVEAGEAGANQIDSHKVIAYARNVWTMAERGGVMVNLVDSDLNDTSVGSSWDDGVYARTEVATVVDEFAPQDPKRLNRGKRGAFWSMRELTHIVGAKEKAEQLDDPTNDVVIAHGEAVGFHEDKTIINSMFGNVLEYQNLGAADPTNPENWERVSIAFPAANVVAADNNEYWLGKGDGAAAPAAGPRGLTVGKLMKARELAKRRRMKGQLCIAASEDDILSLLTSVPVASADYNTVKALYDGELTRFMGFEFAKIYPDAQPGHGTAAAVCPVWVKGAVKFKRRKLVTARIRERADLRYNTEAYMRWDDSTLRRDDTSVFKIENDHTV